MQRLGYLFTIFTLFFVGCMPVSQPVDIKTTGENVSATESTSPITELASDVSCLSPTLKMNAERAAHSATLLPDGKVLIAGGFREEGTSEIAIASAEIFDPATNSFTPTSDMNEPRNGHTATLLPNGKVLLAGGWNQQGRTATAELYDPQTGTFKYTGSLMSPRQGLTATLLENGQVLIAGGDSARNTPQLIAELYDPATETFAPAESLKDGRFGHTATLLAGGKVLLVGGTSGNDNILASAEIYDPETGQFTSTSDANMVRYKHTAVLLRDGNVLILGGTDQRDWNGKYDSAEIYDVDAGTFTQISDMSQKRFKLAEAAVLLANGNVLIGGGNRQIEIFDAQSQTFIADGTLDDDYYFSVLTGLNSGQVLITGGYNGNILPSDKAWLYCG
ncbi:MAG TPA: kelch repeat-containing protein [Anaerolineales bacterium]|nr:kelch repeat-containing protein [Anaerolineales bacterium]